MSLPEELTSICLLDKSHNRTLFNSGNQVLDRYLREQSRQDSSRNVCATFVIPDNRNNVQGFYTLSSAAIESSNFPSELLRKLPRYTHLPVTLLGRLAVDMTYQSKGVGEFLLLDALHRCFLNSATIGAMAVVVEAKNFKAEKFYQRFDFQVFKNNPTQFAYAGLFMPMSKIKTLFSS